MASTDREQARGRSHGRVLWTPAPDGVESTRMAEFTRFVRDRYGAPVEPDDYGSLHAWSIERLERFWRAIAEFFEVELTRPADAVLVGEGMPGHSWFPGSTLSYAAHVFRGRRDSDVAILHADEDGGPRETTWGELRRATAKLAAHLRESGVGPGDRVAAYLPNGPEAVAAFLASASIGATWSSCSPDFGAGAAIDRLGQIRPKALFAVLGYSYGGRWFDRTETVRELAGGIEGLEQLVIVGEPPARRLSAAPTHRYDELLDRPDEHLEFAQLPFDHPLWVLYSSGTTGLPKGLVHGQGGILLEHLKWAGLQCDLGPSDRLFWMTTTGWTMWNFLVGGLLTGASIVCYDGNPGHPDLEALWDLAEEAGVTCFGAGAGYYASCRAAGVEPRGGRELSRLRSIGSTGSPLTPEDFEWVYEQLPDVWLFSTSGGTDVCTAFVGGTPTLPVRIGEIQAPALGVDVQAWGPDGERLPPGEVGELVVTKPMPSMPLRLWGDPDGSRYRGAYFETYPGAWRHGDWIEMTPSGGAIIHGRSDSTINRGGVRIGSSEIYRAVLAMPGIEDAVVVDVPRGPGRSEMMLFVKTADGTELDPSLEREIAAELRRRCSPRHVPDLVERVPDVPRTISGKVVETPLRRILTGTPAERAVSRDSLANPGSIDWFTAYAETVQSETAEEAA